MTVPAAFEYHAPRSLRQAIVTLKRFDGDARVLAGGMSLVPMMKLRLANPEAVVDLSRIEGLADVGETEKSLAIGPMATHHTIESSEIVQRRAPLLAEAASTIGDVQVRNRGTIGGSVAHADPAADLPAALLAHEATFRLAGGPKRRTVRANQMFVDAYTSALAEGEIIAEIRVPFMPERTGWAYEKLPNRASRFAVVGVAALVTRSDDGTCAAVRIGVTGAGPAPSRAKATERYLKGKPLDNGTIAKAARRASQGIDFLADVHGSAAYREALTVELTRRALARAVERA